MKGRYAIKGMVTLLTTGLLMALSGAFFAATKVDGMTVGQAFPVVSVRRLIDAAVDHDVAKVRKLAAEQADVNAVGAKGLTPLIWLYLADDVRGMEILLDAGANPNYQEPVRGVSALSLAIRDGNAKALAVLLAHKGDPNLAAPDGEHLLHVAAVQRDLKCFHLLMDAGADVNLTDKGDGTLGNRGDHTAANKAIIFARFELIALMLDRGLTYDLQTLALDVCIRHVATDSEAGKWKDKVKAMLHERGVEVPERSGGSCTAKK